MDSSIPIEIVDDDELAAIETAFLQVSSVQSALSHPKTYVPLTCDPPLRRVRSLAESANYWLTQCLNVQDRAKILEGGTNSETHIGVHSTSSTSRSTEISLHPSVECCYSRDKALDSKDETEAIQVEPPRGDTHEVGNTVAPDIEDLPCCKDGDKSQAEEAPPEPKPRCLSVTDFTAFEWCEKQVEFAKRLGKPKQTEAMKAGSARHAELEVEVLKKVEVEITSKEDSWAMRLINFITGARQMLAEGMTRELPVVGLIGGAWVVGIIDELKLCDRDGMHRPQLIDTKTRNKPTPPSSPQKQNGRMQLMVYKCMWDNIVTSGIPFNDFFEHFRLRPQHLLSEDIRVHAAEVFPDAKVENLQDVARMYSKECITFPESHSLLLLRYEWQADRSLLGQDEFDIEREWLDLRINWHLEFWHGLREPAYVPEDETWKCRYCTFAELCPAVQALSLGNEPKAMEQNTQNQNSQLNGGSGHSQKP